MLSPDSTLGRSCNPLSEPVAAVLLVLESQRIAPMSGRWDATRLVEQLSAG